MFRSLSLLKLLKNINALYDLADMCRHSTNTIFSFNFILSSIQQIVAIIKSSIKTEYNFGSLLNLIWRKQKMMNAISWY